MKITQWQVVKAIVNHLRHMQTQGYSIAARQEMMRTYTAQLWIDELNFPKNSVNDATVNEALIHLRSCHALLGGSLMSH